MIAAKHLVLFEPTLQGSYVIYTIHGFTAGAFTVWIQLLVDFSVVELHFIGPIQIERSHP